MIDLAEGLIESAERSIAAAQEHGETEKRRAVVCCYYAVYHALAKAFADALLGDAAAARADRAWVEVYRGLDHRTCYEACTMAVSRRVTFPDTLLNVAAEFQNLQKARHRADYDPRDLEANIDLNSYLETARECVRVIREVAPNDIKAFATWVLISSKGAKDTRQALYPMPKPVERPANPPGKAEGKRKQKRKKK